MTSLEQLIHLPPLLEDERRDRITLLISGKRFVVQNRQLKRYPQTLLGDEEEREKFFDSKHQVYRFNRHPSVFESILYYYLSPGILLRPPQIEAEIFYDELRYWKIDENLIETFIDEDMLPFDDYRLVPAQKWRRTIWTLLTYPRSIRYPYGEIFIGISILITLISCIPLLSEIVPTITECRQMQVLLGVDQIDFPLLTRFFYLIEIICLMAFSVELIVRIVCAPTFKLIRSDLLNFLDFIVIMSIASSLIICHLHNSYQWKNFLSVYYWFLILKSFRIYRVARHMSHLRLLYTAIAMCLNEVCTLLILVTFFMIFFGLLMFMMDYSEAESNTRNLLDGFWLAFITLTTLGYGDIYPRSFEARLVASVCALIGIIVFSLPATTVFVKYSTLVQNQWKRQRNIRYIISTSNIT